MAAHKVSFVQLALALVTLAGGVVTAVFFIAPLRTLPQDLEKMRNHLQEVATMQRLQAQALASLAEVAADTKTLRRDVDKNRADIELLKERIARLHD